MEEVPGVRSALYEMVSDIEPAPFRETIEAIIADASLTPGVLTVRTARVLGPPTSMEAARRRGASVQLKYEGLRLTRHLARDEPWRGGDLTDYDLDFVVASTLVSRGFYHLAETGVAPHAIEMVRRLGRNQTYETQLEAYPPEPSLEVDIVTLAVKAGADLVLSDIPPALVTYAEGLATDIESKPLHEPETAIGSVDGDLEQAVGFREPGD
jgi:hypothetical protein